MLGRLLFRGCEAGELSQLLPSSLMAGPAPRAWGWGMALPCLLVLQSPCPGLETNAFSHPTLDLGLRGKQGRAGRSPLMPSSRRTAGTRVLGHQNF